MYYASKKKDLVLELASLLGCLLWLEVNAPFSFKAVTASTTLVPGGNDLGQAVPSTVQLTVMLAG